MRNIVDGKLHSHYKRSNIFIIIYIVLLDFILNEEWNKLGFERAIINNKYCSPFIFRSLWTMVTTSISVDKKKLTIVTSPTLNTPAK